MIFFQRNFVLKATKLHVMLTQNSNMKCPLMDQQCLPRKYHWEFANSYWVSYGLVFRAWVPPAVKKSRGTVNDNQNYIETVSDKLIFARLLKPFPCADQ